MSHAVVHSHTNNPVRAPRAGDWHRLDPVRGTREHCEGWLKAARQGVTKFGKVAEGVALWVVRECRP